MKIISLEQLLQNPRLIGAQIRIKERDKTYCGPITRASIEGSSVLFRLSWSAAYDENKSCWVVAEYASGLFLDTEKLRIEIIDLGIYSLSSPSFITGSIFLYPRNHLDPDCVHGLDLKNLPQPQVVEFHEDTDEVTVS